MSSSKSNKRKTQRMCIICIMLSLVSGWVQAAVRLASDRVIGPTAIPNMAWRSADSARRFFGVNGGLPPNIPTADYASGVPVSWSAFPSGIPREQWHQNARTASAPPRIEVQLTETDPYVQQTILYTVRVISDTNLKTLEFDLPSNEELMFEQVSGPITGARELDGVREIVNEYVYALIPLKAGTFPIPPIRVRGSYTEAFPRNAWQRQSTQTKTFSISSPRTQVLRVKRADPSVRPWLPLHNLTMKTKLEGSREWIAKGEKSLTLSVTLMAEGVGGASLPSLESQLRAPGLRVYREASSTRSELSADKTQLIGQRSETFTLVNAVGTGLSLPAVHIPWWNVESAKREDVALPIRPLIRETRGANSDGLVAKYQPVKLHFGAFLITIIGLSLSVWFWLWSRDRPIGTKLRRLFRAGYQLRHSIIQLWISLSNHLPSLRRFWGQMQRRLIRSIPLSVRLWYCIRCIQKEGDPSKWCQMFMFIACKHLNISPHATLPKITDELIMAHPLRAQSAATFRQLMQELADVLYGDRKNHFLDFPSWKKTLKHQFNPLWRVRSSPLSPQAEAVGLPALNPKAPQGFAKEFRSLPAF